MEVVTPFDLVEAFPPQQKVAIVGNAASIRGSGLGGWIERHDVVVRFNECALAGFESDIGTRTDILVSNPYPEKRTRPLLDGMAKPKLVLILSPQTRRGTRSEFEVWAGNNRVLFSYTPDLKTVHRVRHDVSLTTGTYAISLLHNLIQPSSMSILGFTMFLPGATTHYWNTAAPSGIAAHKPSREAQIFIDLVNGLKCPVEVGEDIRWVSEQVGLSLRRRVRVRRLPGWSPQLPASKSISFVRLLKGLVRRLI